MSTPTYRDIQKITGLSLSTISRYFNGEKLRSKSVDLIEEAIISLDYKPQKPSFINKKAHSNLVGLLLPNLTHSPFYMQLCFELEHAFMKRGMSTLVCKFAGPSEYDEKSAIKLLLENNVCAIIAIPNETETLNLVHLQNRNIPIVLLDKLSQTIKTDAVVVDNRLLAAMAVEEFCSHNHKKIAIISSGTGYTSQLRTEGYIETMQKHKLPIVDEYIVHTDASNDFLQAEVMQLLTLKNPPTAIFCANYRVMLVCLTLLKDLNLKIPDDISVIGIDDYAISRITTPRLTMMLQPIEKIADCAADIIIDKLSGKREFDAYNTLELPTVIVRGESIKML